MFERNHAVYPITLSNKINRYPCYDSIKSKSFKRLTIRPKQSCFFEHEEIKKPLQLPEILGLRKAQK